MLNWIKYRRGYSVLADGYLPVCELKRCSVARAKFFVSSAERWEPTHCNQTLILQPLLLAAHYWINSEFTAKAESLCVCVCVIHLGSEYVRTPRWLWRSQTWARAGKTKAKVKKQNEFGFFMLKNCQLSRILKRTEGNPKLILSTFYRGTGADQILSRRCMGRGVFALHFEKAAFLYVAIQVSR